MKRLCTSRINVNLTFAENEKYFLANDACKTILNVKSRYKIKLLTMSIYIFYTTVFYSRVFTESPAKWLVAYGNMYSLLMDRNSLYVVRTKNEETVAELSLPPFRRSVRGSNFTPGDISWLDGSITSPGGGLLFATSMPDFSVLLLMLKEGS